MPNASPKEIESFESFLSLLIKWNDRAKLVSAPSLSKLFPLHLIDSLFIADFAAKYFQHQVHDLGSGGGFPGMVYAIRFPDHPITLYERQKDKRSFLTVVSAQLNLKNVLVKDEPKEKADGLWMARAVMPREELLTYYSKKMLRGAVAILMTGEEPAALPKDFDALADENYALPIEGSRWVQAIRRL